MPDQVPSAKPRVALIFGDAAAAGHVREALAEQVDIAYDAQAADFDIARLVESRARSALVNLDSYEWLDTLTAQLGKAGVAVVFNDPETSIQLEGWERARWLRHLVAKLRGSDDYDPPRPAPGSAEHLAAPAVFAPAGDSIATLEPVAESHAAAQAASASEGQPLSPGGNDSPATGAPGEPMVAVQTPAANEALAATPTNGKSAPDVPDAAVKPVTAMQDDVVAAADTSRLVTVAADDFDAALDVDTEALSAMIDARLAEPEPHMSSAVAQGADMAGAAVGTPSAAIEPMVLQQDAAVPEVGEHATAPAATAVTPPADDADVLADLPALGDWELVDPDAPIANAAQSTAHAEPTIANDLSGLELVPMEATTPVELHTESVESRLYVGGRNKTEPANDNVADAKGDHA